MNTGLLTETTLDRLGRESRFAKATARALLRDDHLAEDAVQQAWLTLLERPPSDPAGLAAWFTTVSRNIAHKLLRGASRRTRRERAVGAAPGEASPADAALDRDTTARAVRECVDHLDEPYRRTILAHYYEQLTTDDIARRDGVPLATVRSRLQRARKKLRDDLQRRYGPEPRQLLLGLACLAGDPAKSAPATGSTPDRGGRPQLDATHALPVAAALAIGVAGAALLVLGDLGQSPTPDSMAAVDLEPRQRRGPPDPRSSPTRREAPTPPVIAAVTELHLQVLGDDGVHGVAGVRLSAFGVAEERGVVLRSSRTDERGLARLTDLPSGAVTVVADRGVRCDLTLEPNVINEATLLLPGGVDVDGRVLDPTGAPVEGASVWLAPDGESADGAIVATTGVDGSFFIVDAPRHGRVGATADDFAPATLSAPIERSDGASTVTLHLQPPDRSGSIRGRVVGPDGGPVAGALLRVEGLSPGDGITPTPRLARSDADGSFRIDGTHTGAAGLRVRADGFAPYREEVTIDAGAGRHHEVHLARGATVHGRVEHRDGRPAAFAWVRTGGMFDFDASSTWCDSSGRFELGGLPSGAVTLRSSRAGEAASTELSLRSDDVRGWSPILAPGTRVIGSLVDATGRAAGGGVVIARAAVAEPAVVAWIGGDGRFTLDLPPGVDWTLEAGGHPGATRPPLHVPACGMAPTHVTLELELAADPDR